MPHIVVFIHKFFSVLQHLKHYCHIIGTLPNGAFCQCIQSLQLTCPWVATVKRLRYILKYLLDFKNNLINIGCATLYHLSMTYITVYNLSINSNYRILAAELNYRFTAGIYRDPGGSLLRSYLVG